MKLLGSLLSKLRTPKIIHSQPVKMDAFRFSVERHVCPFPVDHASSSLPEIAIVILSSFLSLSLGTFPVHIIRAQVSDKIGKSEITRVGHQLMSDLLLLFELGVFLEVL